MSTIYDKVVSSLKRKEGLFLQRTETTVTQEGCNNVIGKDKGSGIQESGTRWRSGPPSPVLVSIVVTAYSSKAFNNLVDLIGSVLRQKQIVVAEFVLVIERDKQLFEDMIGVLSSKPELNAIIVYYLKLNGMSEARNLGAQIARGTYVAFVDDDVVLDKDWLASLLQQMNQPNMLAATGSAYPIWAETHLNWFPKELSWIVGSTEWLELRRIAEIRNLWGMNMVVRRQEFLDIGGFSLKYGLHNASRKTWADPPSEDVDLSFKLKQKFKKPILFVPCMRVGHKVPRRKLAWCFIAQRSFSVGYQRYAISRLYSGNKQDNMRYTEGYLLSKMALLSIRSLLSLFRSPRKTLNVLSALYVVGIFAALGYLYRRNVLL